MIDEEHENEKVLFQNHAYGMSDAAQKTTWKTRLIENDDETKG